MKQKESNISAITFMWIGMLGTGFLLVIVAIVIHYSDSKEVEDVSLTLLMEEKFKAQDEAGKVLTSSKEENNQGKVQQDDFTIDTSGGSTQSSNSTDVDENSPKLPTEAGNNIEETTISQQLTKIDINTATSEQLQQLKGIGPSKAKAIIEDREQKGKYKNIADIKRVKGIGEKLYAGIQESIVAEP
ncbi:ComEA family DNA-binding protein [Paenibacillus endoradicis]|uniref:ComEA family DNA-binding protein n=1 Tax=Paenibacillus endoradicis TaxID=2972487 RepID=UPI002158E439|nr:helix-hairpin-helix domain-containing protein [Paenibacillus endoradicis]MCR8659165.1 helix-hairpin-helix domain-containing protein [Paenibacillus endoradicis]